MSVMRWTRHSHKKKPRGYHHGNLKEALMAAALDLIAEKGPAGFNFAQAARQAGVSAAAPYRHFRDREALIADVARVGFELLEENLRKAWNEAQPDPLTALMNTGKAYLAFARTKPAYYSAMFEAGLSNQDHAELARAGDKAFDVLKTACEAVSANLPQASRPPSLMMSLHIWSMAHGIASLFGRADPSRRKLPVSPEDLLESSVLLYLQGAGLGQNN